MARTGQNLAMSRSAAWRTKRAAEAYVPTPQPHLPKHPGGPVLTGKLAPYHQPGHEEVIAAVHSLYADELRPYGRILRKRVSERAAQRACKSSLLMDWSDSLPDVDGAHLRQVCEASDVIWVQPESCGDWSALLAGHADYFIDIHSPVDLYPEELWEKAAAYFESLSADDMFLPARRYSCAQALISRNLEFLNGRTLGQVCHIVQLAISQKKLLGYYYKGAVVPYKHSQTKVKEHAAASKVSCSTAAASEPMPVANWEVARACLKEILDAAPRSFEEPGQPRMLPLSNVKRLFRSRFNLELSETLLGHNKLSELLQDVRFSDVCRVQFRIQGHMVLQTEDVGCYSGLHLAEFSPLCWAYDTGAGPSYSLALDGDYMLPKILAHEEKPEWVARCLALAPTPLSAAS